MCYSTTDFFTADFVDNGVGTVVGVDSTTGGGGANVWSWGILTQFTKQVGLQDPKPLPQGYDLNVSMRRAYRTGYSAGLPIEDLGVPADIVHKLTLNDILDNNKDLLALTAAQLV